MTMQTMADQPNSLVIHNTDNVATTMVELKPGDLGRYVQSGSISKTPIMETIPRYHKFALCDIKANALVYKYGEVIGQALVSIRKGSHVHTHNLVSPRKENR